MSHSPNSHQHLSPLAQPAPSPVPSATKSEGSLPQSPVAPRRVRRLPIGESFRGSRLPKLWAEIREKSQSEISLVLDVMRGTPSPTGFVHPDRQLTTSSASAPSSSSTKKRHHNRVHWERYTPNHLNRQLQLGRHQPLTVNFVRSPYLRTTRVHLISYFFVI
ncbi:unnamed protein product [Toxocara canis]|nr:unnamed protein product [Toxocara canis]